jgi:hypothetical protein
MNKELKDMSNSELVDELNGITNFLEYGSIGRSDLMYESACWQEIEKRGLELNKKIEFVLQDCDNEE